ncbi:MAG: NosD domain-containing protein [Halobacteriota archaeon]|uniref:NosD domain-containing protein n=1 Tax=Natronomonas sp. TaxID=2184060 RepID=UPI0039750ACE
MTSETPTTGTGTRTFGAILVGVLIVGGIGGLFIADFGSATPDPVDFDRTVTVGLTLEDELRIEDADTNIELPRMQVFYSQYPYAVGYYGVESFVSNQREPTHEQRFGFPTAAYATDYADSDVELTEDGLPVTNESPGWIAAEEAFYVARSRARTPSGETVVPFGDRESAEAFTDDYGGTVLSWEEVLEMPTDDDDAEAVRGRIATRHDEANETVTSRLALRDRPVETVVGEDEPTVQKAIDAAPPNTTIVVPEGSHEGPLEIDKPVTLRGSGDARIVGDENGTVLTITTERTAVVGVNISGVGDSTPGPTVTDDHSHGGFSGGGSHDHGSTDEDDSWDAEVEDDYAQGDTAVSVEEAADVLVSDTEIHTDAAGIILRDSPEFVVRNTTVVGSDNYREGHMGVVAMRSSGVVERSMFVGGLDGVYTHRADGITVRDNRMRDNRMGIHLMFTSGALLADNAISGQETTGIYVMTGPQRNGIVGNEITDTWTGISVGGSETYVADNVLSENDLGLRIDAVASIFEGNVIADNRAGVETWALLPTNRVTHNDFVGNERHVAVSSGRLRVWSHDGEGNYWEGAVGKTDGTVVQRPYTPTDPVDGRLHRIDGAGTLAQAPALDALAGFEGTVPGMRADEVIDVAPLCAPVNDEWFERSERTDTEPICRSDGRSTNETRNHE